MKGQRKRQHRRGGAKARAQPAASIVIKAVDRMIANGETLGDFAVINTATGEYVTAPSLTDAVDRFQSSFPGAKGFVRRVGEPIYEPLIVE
jgi:hypothetical protein